MSEFRPMTECKGFNMERVLLKNKNGYMITAYFKDGMLQCDGDEDWTQPIAWKGFIRLQDLANGAPTKDSGLHLQHVSVSFFEQLEMQLMYHKDKENERYKCRDYREAMYHNHKAGAIEDVLNWIRHNER